jgi:hypothetical protein
MKSPLAARTPVRPKWTALVAVCRECEGGKRFAKALRAATKSAGVGPVRVVSASCLDVCPKRGVTVATMSEGALATAVVDSNLDGEAAVGAVFGTGSRAEGRMNLE